MSKKGLWVIASLVLVVVLIIGSFGCTQPASSSTPATTPSSTAKPTVTQASSTPTSSPVSTSVSPATPTAAKPIVLKVSGVLAAPSAYGVQLDRAMELIKTRSGGRISFEYHPGASLYNLQDGSNAVMKNLVQIASFKGGYFPDKLGIAAEIANLPYNYPYAGYVAHRRDPGGFYDWISPYYEKAGVKLLTYVVVPSLSISSRKPIRKLEDLKGVLMRCVAGPAADGFKLMGAQTVFLPTGEVYEALLRGTADATNSTVDTTVSDKYYEVCKYFTLCEYSTAGSEQCMNLETLNSLPQDLQKIIIDAFKETEAMLYAEAPVVYEQQIAKLKANNVEVITLDKAELDRWAAAVAPLYDGLAKKYGAEWDKFLKIRETMRK